MTEDSLTLHVNEMASRHPIKPRTFMSLVTLTTSSVCLALVMGWRMAPDFWVALLASSAEHSNFCETQHYTNHAVALTELLKTSPQPFSSPWASSRYGGR